MVIKPSIDMTRVPRHVAIIMDGNGRWAVQRNKPRLFGHKAGVESVREVVEVAREMGIQVLTLYAFSSENWNRPEEEVSGLMSILQSYLSSELKKMLDNGICLRCSGDMDRLPEKVRSRLKDSIEQTQSNTDFTINLALSYGGRDELTRAMKIIAQQCIDGELSVKDINPELIEQNLYTAGLPDPDLVIRTGGEARLSNFLLWQSSYSEIYFTEVMWPDFRKTEFLKSLYDFQNRERRFGKTSAQIASR